MPHRSSGLEGPLREARSRLPEGQNHRPEGHNHLPAEPLEEAAVRSRPPEAPTLGYRPPVNDRQPPAAVAWDPSSYAPAIDFCPMIIAASMALAKGLALSRLRICSKWAPTASTLSSRGGMNAPGASTRATRAM